MAWFVRRMGILKCPQRTAKHPNWRMFEVNNMSDFKVLDETFPGNRPAKQDHLWGKLFIRVGEPE